MKTQKRAGAMSLGKALRLLREYHGLKQNEAAERLGFPKSVVSELESGSRNATLEILARYAESFKMPISSVVLLAELQASESTDKNSIKRVVTEKALKILDWFNERTKLDDE